MERLKRKKVLAAVILLMIAAAALVPAASHGAEYSVVYEGTASDGVSTVGKFTVGGNHAFCCDHVKDTPSNGTKVTSSVEENGNVAKALYYGYGGPKQWSGFNSDNAAIVATSLVLDHYFNGGTGNGNPNYTAFMTYLASKDTSESGTSYILYTSSRYADQRLASVNPHPDIEQEVEINLTKKSANGDITDNNDSYSLKGAKYGVYAGGKSLMTLTTDSKGSAKGKIKVSADDAKKISVKEISPPQGYAVDASSYEKDGSNGTVTLNVKDVPQNNPVDILLQKVSKETGKSTAQGGASLKGAEFTVKYYDGSYSTEDDIKGKKPERTWTVKTDGNGSAALDKSHLVSGDDLYHSSSGKPTLPLGTVTIKETKAPDGYILNDSVYIRQITAEGTAETVNTYNAPDVKEQVKRGDLKMVKVKERSQERLAGIPFMITSQTTGEKHLIVTDENGQASTENSWNQHSSNTNKNDEAYDEASKTADDSKLSSEYGVWFSHDKKGNTAEVKDSSGALVYDTYVLDEVKCNANKGLTLLKDIQVKVYRDGNTVDLGTVTDHVAEIGTSAKDNATGTREAFPGEKVTITDTVSYKGLEKGQTYTMIATIMDKETEKPLEVNGETVTAEKEFTADSSEGSVDVDIEINAEDLAGKEIVVFEKLVKDSGGGQVIVAEHENINDEKQTVNFTRPEIKTTASDKDTGGHMSYAGDKATITDTVSYQGLVPGKTYTMTGRLVDKETGKVIRSEGKEVTAEAQFTPESAEGSMEMTFTFNAEDFKGKSAVVYESLKFEDRVIAVHEDIEDKAQTVYFPNIGTTASFKGTGKNTAVSGNDLKVIDKVEYENISPEDISKDIKVPSGFEKAAEEIYKAETAGKDLKDDEILKIVREKTGKDMSLKDIKKALSEYYVLVGTLMDKTTGKPVVSGGKEVTAVGAYLPEKTSGTFTLEFPSVDISDTTGSGYVVYEKLYKGEALIAAHERLDDQAQSLYIKRTIAGPVTGDDITWIMVAVTLMMTGGIGALYTAVYRKKD